MVFGYLLYFISSLLRLYTLVLMARVVLDIATRVARDWVPQGVVLVLVNFVYRVTDPPLRFLNRFIPPLKVGGLYLDMGFLVLFVGVQVLEGLLISVVPRLVTMMHMGL